MKHEPISWHHNSLEIRDIEILKRIRAAHVKYMEQAQTKHHHPFDESEPPMNLTRFTLRIIKLGIAAIEAEI